MKETELVDKYITFRKQAKSNCILIKEKGYRQKKIDLVEIILKPELCLHGIEFKINNWRLGLKQCLGNRVLIRYNSLALYYKYERNVDIKQFFKYGIGLIILNDSNYDQKILPRNSNLLNRTKYRYICSKIKDNISIEKYN